MTADLTIEPAGAFHPLALAAIHAAAFPAADRWDERVIAGHLSMRGVFGLLSAGGMILARSAADEAEILTLAVLPSCRRRGLGRALLLAAADEAARRGAASLFLEVAESNGAARALYEACGFVPVGVRRRYYPDGSDALALSRALVADRRPLGHSGAAAGS